MKILLQSLLITFSVFSSAGVFAQDISGDYILDIRQDPGFDDCIWEGDLNIVQTGGNPGTFTGAATVTVVSGPCFDFSGTISGTINGSALDIGIGISGLGSATFVGSVVGPNDISGTWSGLGVTGVWSGTRLTVAPVTAIPTLPVPALAILALLMAGIALPFSRRKSI